MPVQTMLSGKEIAGRRDEGVNNPECGTCGAKMKGNGTMKAGAGRGGSGAGRCPKYGAPACASMTILPRS